MDVVVVRDRLHCADQAVRRITELLDNCRGRHGIGLPGRREENIRKLHLGQNRAKLIWLVKSYFAAYPELKVGELTDDEAWNRLFDPDGDKPHASIPDDRFRSWLAEVLRANGASEILRRARWRAEAAVKRERTPLMCVDQLSDLLRDVLALAQVVHDAWPDLPDEHEDDGDGAAPVPAYRPRG